MAERRMFAKTIVLSDAFLDMPLSARCLYFTLGMLADDDGFVNSPKSIMRQAGASIDDLNLLMAKRFIITFDSGVIVIKHWRIHNYIQKDRYKESKYLEEKATLTIDKKGAYTECIQDVYKMDTQVRLDKDKLVEGSVVEDTSTIPTLRQIKKHVAEHNLNVDPDRFFNYYSKTDWKTTKGNPVNWQDKLQEWHDTEHQKQDNKPQKSSNPFLDALKNGDV